MNPVWGRKKPGPAGVHGPQFSSPRPPGRCQRPRWAGGSGGRALEEAGSGPARAAAAGSAKLSRRRRGRLTDGDTALKNSHSYAWLCARGGLGLGGSKSLGVAGRAGARGGGQGPRRGLVPTRLAPPDPGESGAACTGSADAQRVCRKGTKTRIQKFW